jgi:hypothetical protein
MFLIYIYINLFLPNFGLKSVDSVRPQVFHHANPRGWSYDRSRKGRAQISSISSGKHHGKPHEKFNGLVLLGKSEHRKPMVNLPWFLPSNYQIGLSGFNFPIIQFYDFNVWD